MSKNPCEKCSIRKSYAKKFDIHFSGEDCLWYCEPYEKYKNGEDFDFNEWLKEVSKYDSGTGTADRRSFGEL